MASKDKDEWESLLNVKAEDERSDIEPEDFDAAGRDFVVSARSLVDTELTAVAVNAQQQADVYWSTNKAARSEAPKDEQGRVGTRVRMINGSLTIEWYQNRFVDQGRSDKKKQVFSTHIKKGRGYRYSMTNFKKEPQWSQEVIEVVEERYCHLRQRAAALSKVKRALKEYERLLDKSNDLNNESF